MCVSVDLFVSDSPFPAKKLANELKELMPSRANALAMAVTGGACTSTSTPPFAIAAAQPLTMPQLSLMKALQAQGIPYAFGTAQF